MIGQIRKREGKRGVSYQVIVSFKSTDGKWKKKWLTAKTRKDAEALRNEFLVKAQEGINIDPKRISFGEYLDKWLNDYGRTNLAPRTLESYISIINNHLKPTLGNIQLARLSPAHLREFYSKSLTEGRKDGKKTKGTKLTANTVRHFHRLIHLALNQAVKWELVSRNVADAVDPPKQASEEEEETQDMTFLNEEEIERLLNGIKGTYLYLPAYIAINTGMRMGEVLGLRWKDIDFKRETLTVKQTLQTVNREIKIRPKAKTKGSQRTIDLPKNLIQELKKHRLEQKKNMLAFGELYQKQYDLVCCREDGSPIKSSSFGSYFVSMAKRCGLDISFHALRHTHASLLIKAGVHPKVISERLGHSNIGITMDTYGHLMQGMQKEAASRIDDIMQGMNFAR